ncbi:MAG: type II toxin-antitoxin system Phd/YefM family antitoxin [Minisyncoccia bacterium]
MDSGKNYITATKARNNFFELLEKVKKLPYPINITVKGIPEAVIMSKEEYESWVETVETLSDPELMRSIKESEKDIKAGRYSTLEEVEEELGIKNFLISDKGKKKYVSGSSFKLGKKRSKKA